MTLVTRSFEIQVQVSPDVAYAYVSDLTRHPEWSGGALTIQPVAPGPAEVGKRYRSQGEFTVQKARPNELRVSRLDPPARFGFVANDPDLGDVTHEFTFEPQAGGTLVRRTVSVTMPPVQAFLFTTFLFPLTGRPMMNKSMAALKSRLEGRS